MRILHVGSGFRPWRRGGLVAYSEDLMSGQAGRGHDVRYLFSGRHYPRVGGPRLRRWERGGVRMYEVVNSPLHDHGRQPALELSEPRVERLFARLLAEIAPDVVHVQELAGLPSSVLALARDAGVPTVLTLHDFFLLCPTFRLLDAEGRTCLSRDVGAECVAATAADPRPEDLLFDATLRHDLGRLPGVRRLGPERRGRLLDRASRLAAAPGRRGASADRRPETFQRRRDVNVARLNEADRVLAVSDRVAEIHTLLGVAPARLRTLRVTLAHIERLTPRAATGHAPPMTFATLGALESVSKGGRLLIAALRLLVLGPDPAPLRLLVFGHVDPELGRAARELPGVELRGAYTSGELDDLLDEVDVGLMPSVWEEAHGLAGVEFLAKGIPVVANALGGMVEYVEEGRTGWLNRSSSAGELAAIMRRASEHPEEVAALSARVLEERATFVRPFAEHLDEVEAVYRELSAPAARQRRSAAVPRG